MQQLLMDFKKSIYPQKKKKQRWRRPLITKTVSRYLFQVAWGRTCGQCEKRPPQWPRYLEFSVRKIQRCPKSQNHVFYHECRKLMTNHQKKKCDLWFVAVQVVLKNYGNVIILYSLWFIKFSMNCGLCMYITRNLFASIKTVDKSTLDRSRNPKCHLV